MKGYDLLKSMSRIDDELLAETEVKSKKRSVVKFILPIAACLAVIVSAVLLFGNSEKPPVINVTRAETSNKAEYTLKFNDVKNVSACMRKIPGHFWHDLNSSQLKKVLPGTADKYETKATASYSHADGLTKLIEVSGEIKKDGKLVSVTIAENEVFKDYIIDGEPLISDIEGVKVEAGIYEVPEDTYAEHKYWYYADFLIDNVAYKVEYHGDKRNDEFFTEIVAEIILGGKADLSVLNNPEVPYLREDDLTELQAYSEKDFGAYLPRIPKDYTRFNGAKRFVNQNSDYLDISKSKGYSDVRFRVSKITDEEKARIVNPKDAELYDMSLYPIPWCDSMPSDKSYIIKNPIFRIEDLTLNVIKKRERPDNEPEAPNGIHIDFCVLYGDVIVEISAEGISAEYLFNELTELPRK